MIQFRDQYSKGISTLSSLGGSIVPALPSQALDRFTHVGVVGRMYHYHALVEQCMQAQQRDHVLATEGIATGNKPTHFRAKIPVLLYITRLFAVIFQHASHLK